ncbi:hypothetical protein Hdeb2414_s0016g00481651 [Helianthus debilis subsp. tardiflorus]
MEDTLKDQTSVSGTKGGKSSKLLRYPLRSASKPKDDKLSASSPSIASASRRGKPASSVSQSVDVLETSAKEKSAKPPRRLSIPSKPIASPATKSVGYITPISEARAKRTSIIKGKSVTPGSDVSRSLSQRKFTVLSSASYWLSHIKLSEAAGKHQLSLGFFKLALDAGCENVQLLKDELKSYACRHNLGESAKEVFDGYGIQESVEQLQVSVTCSHVPEDDDAHSLSSAAGASKLKPKSLTNSASSVAKESVREATQKSNSVSKTKAPMIKKIEKNGKKTIKQESNKEKQKVKTDAMKPADEKAQLDTSPNEAVIEENKENMNAPPPPPPQVEEVSLEA